MIRFKQLFENSKERKYGCFMVFVPKDAAEQFITYGTQIPNKDLRDDGRELESHITIKYGIDEEVDIKKFTEEILNPFLKDIGGRITATLGAVEIFRPKDKDYDVVVIKADSEHLKMLNAIISLKYKCKKDNHPTYTPHLTIAYVAKSAGDDFEGDKTFEGTVVEFTEVVYSDPDSKHTIIPA